MFPLPCSLKGPGTCSWIPGPGETPREDPPHPIDKSHHFTYGPSSPCPRTRQGSQPQSESEVMEEERPGPSQHKPTSQWPWPRAEHLRDSEVYALPVLVCCSVTLVVQPSSNRKMSREGHEKLLSHPVLRFLLASWLRQGGIGLIYTVSGQVFSWMQLPCFGKG